MLLRPEQTKFTKNTEIYKSELVKSSVVEVRAKLKKVITELFENSSILNYGNTAVRTCPIDLIRVFSEVRTNDKLELTIKNMFLNCILSCERKSIGSGIICSMMLADPAKKIEYNLGFFRDTIHNSRKVAENYINSHSYCYKLAIESIKVGGIGCKVFLKKSRSKDFFIRSIPGEIITANFHELFQANINKIDNPYVMFVDGILESLGEIDGLLQDIAKNKVPCCIFARGFNPDISQTLLHNYKQKRLSVFPIVYPGVSGEEIADFCTKNNISLFEPTIKNDIRYSKVKDLSMFDSVYVENNTCTISSNEGNIFQVEISIPERFNPIMGLIEDRIKFTKSIIETSCRSGIAEVSGLKDSSFLVPNTSLKEAILASESLEKNLSNLQLVLA